jgi:hypothetical protein
LEELRGDNVGTLFLCMAILVFSCSMKLKPRRCLRHRKLRCKTCRNLARRKNRKNGSKGAQNRWKGHRSAANELAKKLGISRQAAYWRLKKAQAL